MWPKITSVRRITRLIARANSTISRSRPYPRSLPIEATVTFGGRACSPISRQITSTPSMRGWRASASTQRCANPARGSSRSIRRVSISTRTGLPAPPAHPGAAHPHVDNALDGVCAVVVRGGVLARPLAHLPGQRRVGEQRGEFGGENGRDLDLGEPPGLDVAPVLAHDGRSRHHAVPHTPR